MSLYPQRQPPRFVPTLTQVVAEDTPAAPSTTNTPTAAAPLSASAASAASPTLQAAAPAVVRGAIDMQQLEEKLMARLQTLIEERVATLMHKQMPVLLGAMTTEMLHDIHPVVQQALKEIESS